MPDPIKGVAFTLDVSLVDRANRPQFKVAPTLAAGDVKIAGANGADDLPAFASITTLPTVRPAGSTNVQVQVSASEANFDRVKIQFRDVAGAEWDDLELSLLLGPGETGVGPGAVEARFRIRNTNMVPVPGADVWITTSPASSQTSVIKGPLVTDAQGWTPIKLYDPGIVYVWAQRAGQEFANPTEETITS